MTAFILVPGVGTGGWIWERTATRLREAGAEAHPVTLAGMGDRRHEAGPGTDLETHIQDLVRLIDSIGSRDSINSINSTDTADTPDVVLVGHDYGIHPALGAAGRRPQRIARIVHLDVGMPQDGDPALTLVPDQTTRDRLLHPTGDDWRMPLPSADEWQRWGSVADLPADALARLTRLAAPQPLRTLTQPLRLPGAVSELPTTGILCTANGSSIALLENLLALGDPRLQVLTHPRVRLIDLDTGHWPMLSSPDELADTLLRAAAGEGHRLTAGKQRPGHLRPFLLDVPGQRRERIRDIDLHLPDADGPRPAVVFVHGGPVSPDARPTPRDWPAYIGYGQYVASLGAVGVTFDHRLHDLTDYPRAAEDVAETVDLVRADPRVDGDRVALWFFSGGGLLSADWLAAPPPWLRCVAATYSVLAPLPNWGLADTRFRPATAVRTAGRLPIVLTRAELDLPQINATIDAFLAAAEDSDADTEVIHVPLAHHGFETLDHTEPARHAVDRAVRSVLGHLRIRGATG
ncbi:alpha/beta hydrolase [Streptomyces sp. NPDC002537]